MTACSGTHDDDNRPESDVGRLCGGCFSRLRSQLVALPAVAAWLEVNLAAAGTPGERVSGSREDPIPLRLNALDLIGPSSLRHVAAPAPAFVVWQDGDVLAECTSWPQAAALVRAAMTGMGVDPVVVDVVTSRSTSRDELREHAHLAAAIEAARARWQIRPTERGGCDQLGQDAVVAALRFWAGTTAEEGGFAWTAWEDRNVLSGLVRWLSGHLSWIADREWVGEFATEVRQMTSQAHRVVPWREEVRRDRDPCPACNRTTVVLHLAQGVSRCERKAGGCGRSQPLSEYVLNAVLPKVRRAG